MYNITLLSSFHKIHGKCNPSELYMIIEEIQPEIIFEELSHKTFDLIYSEGYKPQSLEAIAIKSYLQKHFISHLPVDTYPINHTALFCDAQIIWENNLEYRELWNQQLQKIYHNGYSFINSNECIEMLDKTRAIEEFVLVEMKNEKLLNELRSEMWLHDKRENEMLKNIYDFSKQCKFNNALFVCGVEHRKSLIKKLIEYEKNESVKLNWTMYSG